jgi:hypothetical protein
MEDESAPPIEMTTDFELRQMLGLFDAPAFVRRGQELEQALSRLSDRLRVRRNELLDMVRLRLRQWASVASGPDDAQEILSRPIDQLWLLTGAGPPTWSERSAPLRRRRAVARDLITSLERFNTRWEQLLAVLKLDGVNQSIDHYNRYYVLEKECILGSTRLAARHFVPRAQLSVESLLSEFPPLPVPELY